LEEKNINIHPTVLDWVSPFFIDICYEK